MAELKGTDSYFAVKCLKKDVVLEDDDVECTMIERKVLLIGSRHPYLCHLLCTFQSEVHANDSMSEWRKSKGRKFFLPRNAEIFFRELKK